MNASSHRARARAALKGHWPMAALVTLIASLLGALSASGSKIELNLDSPSLENLNLAALLPDWMTPLVSLFSTMLVVAVILIVIIALVAMVIASPVRLGYYQYMLKLMDGQEANIRDLFAHFRRIGSVLVMNLVRSLLILAGMFLFIVPGIILHYSYSMAEFIMLEDPNCTGIEALRRSRAMMKGRKLAMLGLDLSFIGWYLLVSITGGLASIWVTPYITATKTNFYNKIK